MCERLKDKVAIVTGAGSRGQGWGNGKATAVLFAREGAKILAVDINLAAAEETKGIIVKEGGDCEVYQADVAKSDEVRAMVDRCIEVFGRIDILHNNVGISDHVRIEDTSEESWNRVLAVNLTSQFLTCKYVLPYMEKQGGGAIVNISSIAAIRTTGVPYLSYASTKAAVIQLTQNIALGYADKQIRANVILPGFMNTPMVIEPLKKRYTDEDIEKIIKARDKQCPMKKMGDAWDIAYAALFLSCIVTK